jgi:hypothetical protein
LRFVTGADTVFFLFLDAFSKVPDTYVEQTAFGAAGKAIHVRQSDISVTILLLLFVVSTSDPDLPDP